MKLNASVMLSTLVLAGCTTSPVQTEIASVEDKPVLHIGQVGSQKTADFVFCESKNCPKRTSKYLPSPEQRPVVKNSDDVKPESKAEHKPAIPQNIQAKVHFRWGWSKLDQSGHKEVRELLNLESLRTAKEIVIAGRTDPTGSKAFNKRLAINRAKAVKAELVKAGIPSADITTQAQNPCCDGEIRASKEEMKPLRRTDIEITIKIP